MSIEIGGTVARLRREKGVTQEKLAAAIGVSAPAVSKWETGQSYPDITLLPPLARFFSVTVDELLAYHATLDDAEIERLTETMNRVFAREGVDAGLAACEAALHEYPKDARLRIALVGVLMQSMVLAGAPEQLDACRAAQERWLKDAEMIAEGDDIMIARYMLAMMYMGQRRLEEAETALLSIREPEPQFNTRQSMTMLRRLQGRYDEAERMAQHDAFSAAVGLINALALLSGISLKRDDVARAARYVGAAEALLPALQSDAFAFAPAQAKTAVASASGDRESMLDAAEWIARAAEMGEGSRGPLFDLLPPPEYPTPEHARALREMIRENLGPSEMLEMLRDDPRFVALLKTLEEE